MISPLPTLMCSWAHSEFKSLGCATNVQWKSCMGVRALLACFFFLLFIFCNCHSIVCLTAKVSGLVHVACTAVLEELLCTDRVLECRMHIFVDINKCKVFSVMHILLYSLLLVLLHFLPYFSLSLKNIPSMSCALFVFLAYILFVAEARWSFFYSLLFFCAQYCNACTDCFFFIHLILLLLLSESLLFTEYYYKSQNQVCCVVHWPVSFPNVIL